MLALNACFMKGNIMSVPPIVLSTIVCERALFDAPTRTTSLISIIDVIASPSFPLRLANLVFFAELTNGHDETPFRVRLLTPDEKVLAEQCGKIKFEDVKRNVSIVLHFQGLMMSVAGEYTFQLFAGDELLSTRRVVAVQAKPPAALPNPPPLINPK